MRIEQHHSGVCEELVAQNSPRQKPMLEVTQADATEKLDVLLTKYEELAREIFGSSRTPEEIVHNFNRFFRWYQDEPKKKMDPKFLAGGSTSCSAAALLAGIHWKKLFGFKPIFLIAGSDHTKPTAHIQVYLPKAEVDSTEVEKLFSQKQNPGVNSTFFALEALYGTKNPDMLDQNSSDGSVKLSEVKSIPRQFSIIFGITEFIRNRLIIFPIQ